jgi:phospholipid transport system substrate-binding protein
MRGFDVQLASWTRVRTAFWLLAVMAGFAGFMANDARAESPAVYMQRVQNELIAAQRSGGMAAFGNVLRQHMDVPSVGLTALGPYARSLPKPERPTYYNGMINFIAKYAANTSPKYPVANATVTGQGPGDSGGTYVDSHIALRSGDGYDVRWLVVKSGGGYKVRDAQVLGFWVTVSLNDLFQNWLAENGSNPHALVVVLNR